VAGPSVDAYSWSGCGENAAAARAKWEADEAQKATAREKYYAKIREQSEADEREAKQQAERERRAGAAEAQQGFNQVQFPLSCTRIASRRPNVCRHR
jgi:hypothetical protein